MRSHFEQEALGRIRYEELLAQAELERQYARLHRQRVFSLSALFQPLAEQLRRWVAPRQAINQERIATASRQQAC